MKKILLFGALLFTTAFLTLLVGCRKEQDFSKELKECESKFKKADSISKARPFAYISAAPPLCGNQLPIDANSITNYEDWIKDNPLTADAFPKDCNDGVMIDVNNLKPNPVDWLRTNQGYICYGHEFDGLIECRHTLDYSLTGLRRLGEPCASFSWAEFKHRIGLSFATEKFKQYVNLDVCQQSDVTISIGSFSQVRPTSYPFPLLRAIERNNNMSGNEIVKFYQKNNVVYFAIVFDAIAGVSPVKIYNFSQPLP